jgi:hypothetical protein
VIRRYLEDSSSGVTAPAAFVLLARFDRPVLAGEPQPA